MKTYRPLLRAAVATLALTLVTLTLVTACGDDGGGASPAADTVGADASGLPDITDEPDVAVAGPDVQAVPYEGWEPLDYAGNGVGTSMLGRTIAGERFGNEGPTVFLFFTIHGNERPAEQLGQRMRTWLLLHPEATEGVQIVFVTQANPDGYLANTRHNSSDVDLNRNFPSENYDDHDGSTRFGPYAASETETQAIVALVEDLSPTAIVSTHSPLDVVNYDPVGWDVALAYAEAASDASGYPILEDLGPYPGSFGSYAGLDLRIPTITLETERDIATRIGHEPGRRAIAAVLAKAAAEGEVTAAVADVVPGAYRDDLYGAWKMGDSAGQRPLVAERFGGQGTPVLVVAGLDGEDTGVFLAERLRADLLGKLLADMPPQPVVLVTVANPDGVVAGRRLDNDGVAPDENFPTDDWAASATAGAEALTSPEAAALVALFEEEAPAAVVVLRGGEDYGVAGDGAADGLINSLQNELSADRDDTLAGVAGSFASWAAAQGVPALTLAIPTLDRYATSRADEAAAALVTVLEATPR